MSFPHRERRLFDRSRGGCMHKEYMNAPPGAVEGTARTFFPG